LTGKVKEREAALVLPNQLFSDGPPGIDRGTVYLVESARYFSDFRFHKKKILFHRASMQSYREALERNFDVEYVRFPENTELSPLLKKLNREEFERLHYYDPVDHDLRLELEELQPKVSCTLVQHENPNFLTEVDWFSKNFPQKNYRMTQFYRKQRKRLDIMVENGKPKGGKWSFDTKNRESLPDNLEVFDLPSVSGSLSRPLETDIDYVQRFFPENPGTTEDFIYPVSRDGAKSWYEDFLEKRFAGFGPYQDAISREEPFLFHSLISPLLNVGLLNPRQVVEQAINAAKSDEKIELNSLEGFVRQIIGWREYVRLIYELEGKRQKESNHWNNTNPMPHSFYTASTGIPPVDRAIDRIRRFGYLHHIERLMVIGNFALLCEIDPDEVYRWFMEMSIDSYDWVMTPNVYGMSQFADGGLITTKPYISSSNYVRKMSDYPEGDWCDVWDGLFWRFIKRHSAAFGDIPRASVMVTNLKRMDDDKLSSHLETARGFLEKLFT